MSDTLNPHLLAEDASAHPSTPENKDGQTPMRTASVFSGVAADARVTSLVIDDVDDVDRVDGLAIAPSPEEQEAALVGAFAEQLVGMLASATTLLTVELGRRFGLYRALREHGPMTADRLSRTTGVAPRYALEWLEQQAAAGLLAVEDAAASRDARRFSLPAHHAPVLVDETHPAHAAPVAGLLAGVALAFPEVVADFRLGRGVAFEEYGAELRQGLGALNRPGFTHEMRAWVETLPDRAAALDAGGLVLDAGCGTGWSTIALATAFPSARVIGLDLDGASIDEAREHAVAAGVVDRVVFLVGNAGDTRLPSATRPPRSGRSRRAPSSHARRMPRRRASTSSRSSRRCTTWADRWTRSPRSGRSCARTARSSWPTSGSPTSSTPTPTPWSACSTR
jgi:hypothetical protein